MLELLVIGGLCGALAADGAFRWAGKAFWGLVILAWLLADPLDFLLWFGIAAAGLLAWRLLQPAGRPGR